MLTNVLFYILFATNLIILIFCQEKCENEKKLCNNGQCISMNDWCNGKVDCADGSDETRSCLKVTCPKDSFRCSYGACIEMDSKCNNITDCYDGSDETVIACSGLQLNSTCPTFQIQCNNLQCIPEYYACDGKVDCTDGSDETINTCANQPFCPFFAVRCSYGACISKYAKCDKRIDCADRSDENNDECLEEDPIVLFSQKEATFKQHSFMTASVSSIGCSIPYGNVILKDTFANKIYKPGTLAPILTSVNYSCPSNYVLDRNINNFCDNDWIYPHPKCIKMCPPIEDHTIEVICNLNGEGVDCKRYVAPGTNAKINCAVMYRKPDHVIHDDLLCQNDGQWSYSPFKCKQICGIFKEQNEKYFQSGRRGIVAGWGIKDDGNYSSELRSVELLSIDTNTCKAKLSKNDRISDDKFCVETSTGKNFCFGLGYSGAGYVAPEVENNAIYYHIWGVVSNGIVPTKDGVPKCDLNFIVTFTNVQYYKQMIVNAYNNAYAKSSKLVGNQNINNFCNDDWVNPHKKCIKMCPPIVDHTIEAICNLNGERVDCKKYVAPGTNARINCAVMYRKPGHVIHEDLQCQNDGQWNYQLFKCEQICGTVDTKVAFSVNSEITALSQVPWHVGIYVKRNDGKYEHICGGTLYSSKIVITAAHCFWDSRRSTLEEKSKFLAIVGKVNRDYNAYERFHVQESNISKIDYPLTFRGADHDYANDIAVLTLNDHIVFKNHIRPVCLTFRKQNEKYIQSNIYGIVAGWGIKDDGNYSSELRSVELVSIDTNKCKAKISKNDRISDDKFCIETSTGKNVCQGDNGEGFIVPEDIDNATYYHIWGVVSNGIIPISYAVPKCDLNFTVTFTNVQYYEQLIIDAYNNAYAVI